MKRVITAINNKKIIEKISKNKNLKIIFNNLEYREGILEVIEKIKNIDMIIISELIPGEISIEELIKKIRKINKKIEIIFILNKDELEKINKLKELKINKIYIEDKNNKKIKNKINILKINNEKIKNKINIIKKNNKKTKNKINMTQKNKKIINIFGKNKSGKTTIIILILNYLLKNKEKILIININKKIEKYYLIKIKIINNNKFIKINKYEKNLYNIKKNMDLIFCTKYKQIKNNFEEFKKKYDYILIDNMENEKIQMEYFFNKDYIRNILVIDSENLGISELQNLTKKINKYDQNQHRSLHIIENKYKLSSVSPVVIKEIFDKKIEIHEIYKNRYYKKILEKFLQNKKIKINKLLELKIQKLLK